MMWETRTTIASLCGVMVGLLESAAKNLDRGVATRSHARGLGRVCHLTWRISLISKDGSCLIMRMNVGMPIPCKMRRDRILVLQVKTRHISFLQSAKAPSPMNLDICRISSGILKILKVAFS